MRIQIKDILTLQPDMSVKRSDVYIAGKYILGVDQRPDGFVASKIINGSNRLLIPGLINCHTHSYMNVFRNSADDLSFSDWLFSRIYPMEDKLKSEDGYWGAMLACAEMLSTGTTAFLDMHLFKHQIAKAVEDSGIRACLSRGLVGNGNDEGGKIRLCDSMEEIARWKHCDRLSFMLGPHAVYSCDDKYLETVVSAAEDCGVGIHVHLSESRKEVSDCYAQYGCSPVELLEKCGVFTRPTVAAHCVHLSDNDMRILDKYKVNVASNPISNAKLGNGFAPIEKLQKYDGINICIGTDSAASNNSLNLFSDMRAMALIHKGVTEDAQCVSAYDTIRMATVNGARALNLNCGIISPGTLADLTILNIDKPQFYPRNDLAAALCYSATGAETETVLVDGEIVYDKGEFAGIDIERVYYETEKIARRVR